MDSPAWLPVAIIFGFGIVFPIFWSGVVMLIGLMSGWTSLGGLYRARAPVGGRAIRGMRMGWARYNNVARVDGGPEGLGIDISVFFRPGHPSLRIPWSEVRFDGRSQMFFIKTVQLSLGPAKIRLVLPEAAWDSVAEEAKRGGVVGG